MFSPVVSRELIRTRVMLFGIAIILLAVLVYSIQKIIFYPEIPDNSFFPTIVYVGGCFFATVTALLITTFRHVSVENDGTLQLSGRSLVWKFYALIGLEDDNLSLCDQFMSFLALFFFGSIIGISLVAMVAALIQSIHIGLYAAFMANNLAQMSLSILTLALYGIAYRAARPFRVLRISLLTLAGVFISYAVVVAPILSLAKSYGVPVYLATIIYVLVLGVVLGGSLLVGSSIGMVLWKFFELPVVDSVYRRIKKFSCPYFKRCKTEDNKKTKNFGGKNDD